MQGKETRKPEGTTRDALGRRVTALALLLIRGYKILLSPLFAGCCRFVPSCSDYAAEAIRAYGPVRGVWLAVSRLARCHPFCEGGFDPVSRAGSAPPGHRPGTAGAPVFNQTES